MEAKEFKFKITNENGISAIISLDDLYGYEGETNGVLIKYEEHIPVELRGVEINFNSGYGAGGGNKNITFDYIDKELK